MAKHIILVHGRNYKPAKSALQRNWVRALASGIERDYGKRGLNKFSKVTKEMAYYGNYSNAIIAKKTGKRWTRAKEEANIADRKETINTLKEYKKNEFTKRYYKNIRELEDVFAEAAANIFSGPLSLLGIGDELVASVAPDMAEYWNMDAEFGSNVRWQITNALFKSLKRGDDILLIAHSLGSIACYDVLWKLSHYGEYRDFRHLKINTFATIGSPLGDENAKKQLKGAGASNERRYPTNIKRWINFAAEDDYISHDPTLRNDFKLMTGKKIGTHIEDHEIYNMAVSSNGSNPHNSAGYLIHPKMSKLVHDWLQTAGS